MTLGKCATRVLGTQSNSFPELEDESAEKYSSLLVNRISRLSSSLLLDVDLLGLDRMLTPIGNGTCNKELAGNQR